MPDPHTRLQKARELAGYDTASYAAAALGTPPPTYMAHENGTRGFKGQAERYARFFNVSLEWLLTGRGEARPKSLDARVAALQSTDQDEVRRFIEYVEARSGMKRAG